MKNKFSTYFVMFLMFILATLFACSRDTSIPKISNVVVYKGVNLSGAEFGTSIPGTKGIDYTWPTKTEVDYYIAKGMNTFRLQFLWERLQPTPKGEFNKTYETDLDSFVVYATSKGATVFLNPQNFARYYGKVVGTADVPNDVFADLWRRLALKYANNQKVVFGLVNEPHDMPTEQWLSAANTATAAIRASGASNTISVPGNAWTGAMHWSSNWYGTSNSTVMLQYSDPRNNSIFEVHNYLDSDGSGAGIECASPTIGSERMKSVVAWARTNAKKIMIAEFGAPNTSTCKSAVNDLLLYAKENADIIVGWTWWSAGPWWGNHQLSIEPNNGLDNPKMSWLVPHLKEVLYDAGSDSSIDASSSSTKPISPIAFTKNSVFTFTVNNVTNWAYIPTAYDSTHNTPNSLFVWLHGCGGRGQYDISMISPGSAQTWISITIGGREGTCWSNVATDGSKVLSAIADIKTHFNIDPRRVYLGGYSSGGDIGYPLAFQNAKLFAGVLFENTGPSSVAMTASQAAAWKLNIAHLAHTGDTTYPIANIRSNMTTLKNAGFNVILIEKAGTHWDNDNGAYGTAYDLRTFLLPYLNTGWVSPSFTNDAGAPPQPPVCVYSYSSWEDCQPNGMQTRTIVNSTPNPCTATTQNLTQTCTYVDMTDTDLDTVVNSYDKCPTVAGIPTSDPTTTGCKPLQVTAQVTYDWGTGWCKQWTFKNLNPMPMAWKKMIVYMKDSKLRGPTSVWGGIFADPYATNTVIVTPSGDGKIPANSSVKTVGMCADYGKAKYIGTSGGITY